MQVARRVIFAAKLQLHGNISSYLHEEAKTRHGPAVTCPVKRIAGLTTMGKHFPPHLPSLLFILFSSSSLPSIKTDSHQLRVYAFALQAPADKNFAINRQSFQGTSARILSANEKRSDVQGSQAALDACGLGAGGCAGCCVCQCVCQNLPLWLPMSIPWRPDCDVHVQMWGTPRGLGDSQCGPVDESSKY